MKSLFTKATTKKLIFLNILSAELIALSAGAVEYTDCTSAEG